MSNILDNLNPQQRAAVLHTDGTLRVVAGAGSGKTRVLTRKVAYLIQEVGIPPEQITAITFTNKAAEQMKQRVYNLVGAAAKKTHISTYHSLATRILREHIKLLGYPTHFAIMDVPDQKRVLKQIYHELKTSDRVISYARMIKYISKAKMAHQTPDDLTEEDSDETTILKNNIYAQYLIFQKQTHALDFDDLLVFVLRLFIEHPKVRKIWSQLFKYVLVDEFQDTNPVQYEIIKVLATHNNVTFVGDPDQTIYSWNGACPTLISEVKKDFRHTTTILLNHNYRSTQNILRAANKLISHNSNREKHKELYSTNPDGDKIMHQRLSSSEAEAQWVVHVIKNLQTQKIQFRDIAVFYRSNYLSREIEKAFIEANIVYRIFGDVQFFQRTEVKDCLAYLKMLLQNDSTGWKRMINVPVRGIGVMAQQKLRQYAHQIKKPFGETITNYFNTLPLNQRQKINLAHLVFLVRKYRATLHSNKPSVVLSHFLRDVGYEAMLKKAQEEERMDNVRSFLAYLQEWEGKNPHGNLSAHLQQVALYTDDGIRQDVDLTSYVSLMTIHRSKGTEFDNVFIIGMAEGVFPSPRSLKEDPKNINEERRVAYVGITRARKRLFLSYSPGFIFDTKKKKKISRFLHEMGCKIPRINFDDYSVASYRSNIKRGYAPYSVGDKITHIIFGAGTVVKVGRTTVDVMFHRSKKVMSLIKGHSSIVRR